MTRDEIIELAKQAGFDDFFCRDLIIERLANLVAEKEREACAQVADDWNKGRPETNYGHCIANEIRARGNE